MIKVGSPLMSLQPSHTDCAPFLALRVLQQLTMDEEDRFPQAVPTMMKGRYVDDLFGGADDTAQAQIIIQQLSHLCMAGGFPLKRWISNDHTILNSIPKEDRLDSSDVHIDDNLVVHSLGLLWHPATDSLQFRLDSIPMNNVTKQIRLLTTAFLAPVVVVAKILLQSLWTLKIDWDQPLPPRVEEEWTNFAVNCQDVRKIEVPRWLGTTSSNTMELLLQCIFKGNGRNNLQLVHWFRILVEYTHKLCVRRLR